MRLLGSTRSTAALRAIAVLTLGASACAVFAPDPARDARIACEQRKDGSACFQAGNLVASKAGGTNAEAVRLYTKGCAVRHSPSCEALANVKGPLREQALVDACNGGDLVSCARRAAEFGTDESGLDEARALRHSACKLSVGVKPGMSAREIEGIAESCAALARMIAAGEGGGRDLVAAAKLDVLAANLRNEALYQHEREDDAKLLPHPAQPAEVPRRGSYKQPKPDPTVAEREKFRAEYEARRASREAWIAAVDASLIAMAKKASRGDPSVVIGGPFERATAMMPAAAGGASACQRCTEGCGTASNCMGDDFVGGHCGHLRCAEGGVCSPFDACVAECAAKVEECVKSCGECAAAEPGKGAKQP